MKKCISCLNEIPAKTKFCTKCGGTHFSKNSEIRVDVKAKCPGRNEFCGNELDSNDKFCGECGLEVDISLFKSDELGKQFNKDKNSEVGQDLDTGSDNIQKESALNISETRSSNAESEEVERQTDKSDSEIDSLQSQEHEEKIQSSSVAEENTEEKKCKKKKKKKKKKKHSLKLETEAEDLSDPTLNLPENQETPINLPENQETSNSGDNVDQSLRTYVSEEAEHTNHEMKNAGHMVSKENIKLKDMTKQNEMGELEDLSPKENKETECSEPRPENEKRTNIIQNESKLISTETVNIAAESDSCHSLPEEVAESEFDATDSEQDSLESQETEENITPEKAITKRKPKKKKKKKKKSEKQNGNDSRKMQQKHSDPNTSSDISYPPKINNIISEVTEENKASKDSQMVFGNGKLSVEEKVIKIGQNQDKSDNHKSADDKDGAEGTSVDKPEEKEKKYPTYKEFDPHHKKKKKTTKTAQTSQKTPTEETKPGKTEANSVRLYSDGVEVIFHVLISDTTDHNPDEEDIYLAFSPVELGQWKPTKWIGKLRKTKDYYEYSFSVHMSKQLRNDGFEYKYVFVKNNCTDSEEVHFMKKRTRNPNPDRKFILPKNWKTSSDVWNQYDGFVYHPKPKESLWNKAKSIFKNINTKVKNDTRNAVEHFLPSAGEIIQSLKKEDGQTEDFLSRIFCVMSCLKIQVIDSDGYFDPDFFSECFDLIVLPLYEELRQCINNNKNCGISEHALSVAVFILMLVKENNLEMSKYDDRAGNFFQGLLLKPDFEKECCTNYDLMKRNFPQKKTQDLICKTLEEMVRGHSKNAENDSSWFYCLSLIHFLRGDSEPFKTSQCSEHRNRKWWGTDGFEKIKEDMKHCSDRYLNSRNWTIPVQNVIEDLHMLFEVDYLLPRSIMASLSLGQLESAIRPGKIPPHVVAACLFFHLLSFRGHYTVLELFTKLFKLCASQFNERIEKAIVSSVDKLNEELNISRAIVTDIVKENISGTTDDELVMSIMSVCLSVVDGLKLLQQRIVKNRAESSSEQKNEADNLVQYLEMIALVWLEHKHTFKYVSNHQWSLKAWNNMINIKIQNPELKQHWQKTLLAAFEQKISSLDTWVCDKVLTLGAESEILSEGMKESLASAAFNSFEKEMIKNPSRSVPVTKAFGNLMSKMLEKQWPKDASDDEMLHFVTTYKPLKQYFQNFYGKKDVLLTETCIELLTKACSILSAIVENINKGEISVGNLKQILSEKENIIMLIKAAEKNFSVATSEKTDTDHLLRMMEVRAKELKACDQYLQQAQLLMYFCAHLNTVNTVEMSRTIQGTETKKDKMLLRDICRPAKFNNQDQFNVEEYKPFVNIFDIPEELLIICPQLLKLKQSGLFLKIWQQVGSNSQFGNNLDSVVNIWKDAKAQWDQLSMDIKNGTITFTAIKKQIDMFQEDYDKIRAEFILMSDDSDDNDWVKQRIEQLQVHTLVEKCQKAASEIMKTYELYGITGDFQPVKEILNLIKNRNVPMKRMDKSVLETCSLLKDVTEIETGSLKAFNDSKPLVDWLRQSMKAGIKELKVFVDLAYISAGEGDHDLHKVNCLHTATSGYAPLIFNLDQSCDCNTFLEKCRSVWKELKINPHLPEMLRDTNRFLEWLKEVSHTHGSVEVTSLSQAEMINSKGVYRIGNLTKESAPPNLDLNSIISLHVMPDSCSNVKEDVKKYSHNQLVDLQSRLMLVAGRAEKGKDSVEQFMMVLDGIVRLSKTYIKLVSDGCVLFNCWKATFFCDASREACVILGFGGDSESLKGNRKHCPLVDFVNALANIFDDCHVDWLQYLTEKRNEYLELNFFTINQLVFLQKELIKIGTDEEPSSLIFPMLSLIKPDCSMADIEQAMQTARDEIFQNEEEKGSDMEEAEYEIRGGYDVENSFIQEIVKSGYSEVLARAAFKQVLDADVDEGIMWCIEHENDEEYQTSAVEPVTVTSDPEQMPFAGWTSEETSFVLRAANLMQSLPEQFRKDTSVKSLTGNISKIWKTFLASVSSSVADYLSIEHLAVILKKLAVLCDQSLERKLPVQLKAKTPNLMVCPKSDLLNAVLHLYMEDSSQPLPRADEVLMCTPETTFDEVDIFLRRAFFSSLGKIHCLAYADLLQYEIEEKIEKKFVDYINKANERNSNYKLVILCSSENEYRARLVAALDHHRRQPPMIKITEIKKYLTEKFTETRVKNNMKSASHIDFSNSTVRVVKSKRAGVGKTLYKKRRVEELKKLNPKSKSDDVSVSISLYEKTVEMNRVTNKLLPYMLKPGESFPRIFHFNISYEVQEGLDYLLFNLLILGKVTNENGYIWLRSAMDLYLVEIIPIFDFKDQQKTNARLIHSIFEILPHVTCWSPKDSLLILTNGSTNDDYEMHDLLFDLDEFKSDVYQRPYQYLFRWENKTSFSDINPSTPQGNPAHCLETLLRHCGVPDPSWAELHHFVWFLNTQLCDFERSVFCSPELQDDLPGFSQFVLRFLIQMSRDFATRSLNMSEETPIEDITPVENEEEEVISQFQMRRTWESSPHPYIFFNPDGQTMTFLGFNINRNTGDLIDQQTGEVLEQGIMPKNLQDSLIRNRVPLNENFDHLQRLQRLEKLCSVMPGLEYFYDPDQTYELTTDNVKKILAIFMRFRCNIPVLIMGETGCGKTRLVKFLCSLQVPPGSEVENMVIMKVHGGTTAEDIINKVHKAERLAQANARINEHIYTVLFFDEANTTEAIGLIKEIMCDGTMDGQPLHLSEKLKLVAACNPYRKHSDELIQRLEKAGLGYHVDAEKTTDRLGRVPMRRLVYRVQPLPQSMLPLVWDFGQLSTNVEELYIRQMVNRYVHDNMLPLVTDLAQVLSRILIESQNFMRDQKDECSFVSLRDVERVLKVMSWFYQQSQRNRILFDMMENDDIITEDEDEEQVEDHERENQRWPDDLTKSLILALGVCYRASLRSREDYDEHVTQFFQNPCSLPYGIEQFVEVITRCQDVFLDNVQLEDNIAKNQALKENLFMMIICIELRIPLFLVGKPGSSKSLAKTIVSDAMQGNSARTELFKQLKQAQMVSFQCSPLSIAEGILGTFRQCAQFQKDKDLDRFVSVVVLDEVGLAEDSVRMPLKTLHPLLEDGCQGDEKPEPYKKVAFIGISNWALDPAKMNRGILVQRDVPDETELLQSARGICATCEVVLQKIEYLLPQLAEAYKAVFGETLEKREFFGLRDFYSLVKMVYAFAVKQNRLLCWHQLEHAVLRNFGGLDTVDPVEVFQKKITHIAISEEKHDDDPDNTTAGLIKAALFGDGTGSESRYLLLLTENYGALGIIQQVLGQHSVKTIFGSSFPKDQEYTQICRNINRIKVCMETGNTVILLNLENLYESLYDALNQYYARLGGERFVDLGLGTHRVKCRVHQDFRLIVVAEKQMVYEKFPIPLINRLEKHFLRLNNIMNEDQCQLAEELNHWAHKFVTPCRAGFNVHQKVSVADAFMGYHPDTTGAIVLYMWDQKKEHTDDNMQLLEDCRKMLLWCATPDAVLRLKETRLFNEAEKMFNIYFKEQPHDDIIKYMSYRLTMIGNKGFFTQVTTHSKLLTDQDKDGIRSFLDLTENNIILLTLQSFDTEQQFCQQIRNFVEKSANGLKLLMVQCGSGDKNMSLIKSAQYCVEDELPHDVRDFVVFFIVQLPRVAGGCFTGFMAGKWHSLHIDELRPAGNLPSVHQLHKNSPANVLQGRAPREEPSGVTYTETRIEQIMDSKEYEGMLDEDMETEENNTTEASDQVLDLENISLQEQEPENCVVVEDKHQKIPAYFHDLILRCIQSAAALVRDDVQDSRRSTKRIEILLHFVENQNSESEEQSFLTGLSNMIIKLLEEKEIDISGHIASNWLSNEAAKPDFVKKAGTFRRSWLQCLENKIVTVLAGVVAFLDTNRNLDIIRNTPDYHWAHVMWLRILHSPSVCQLRYQDLLSPETHQELGEIIPFNTGIHGIPFGAELPFSWLLLQLIENNLTTVEKTSHPQEFDDVSAQLDWVGHIILDTPYGNLLNAVSAERTSNQKEIIIAYVKDFVHAKYLCTSANKHEILCEALEIASRQANVDITTLDLISALVAVHYTHSLVMGRLQAFQDIENIWPDVLLAVNKIRENKGHALLNTDEMTLDVLGLILMLEQLEPEKNKLNNENGRSEWLENVKTFLPVIQRILDNVDNVALRFGPVCQAYIDRSRCLWTRVLTMKLFLESFSVKESKKKTKVSERFVTRCMPLWTLLGEEANLKKIHSLEKVERFLKSVNKSFLQNLSEKIGSCSHCTSVFEAPPVVLPCKDKICQKCYYDLLAFEDHCCPKCHQDIPNNFVKNSGTEQKDISEEYECYQKCCNTFLMAVVSNLCFGGDTAPEKAVIDKILSYVTRKTSAVGPGGSQRLQTKQMTVFDDLVDPTPVVRSFLLQLLIHKSGEHVLQHIDEFLHNADILCCQQTGNNSGFLQFTLMVIQCLEDQLHETAAMDTFEKELEMATWSLNTAFLYIKMENSGLDKLSAIANARFGLMIVAKCLHKLITEESLTRTLQLSKMLKAAKQLTEIENFEWPKRFLVKQLCREFGTDSYHIICESLAVPWLVIEEKTNQVKECADRYMVHSLTYQKIRDMVAKTLVGEDVKHLETVLNEAEGPLKNMYLFLAIHREVTLKYIQFDIHKNQALAKVTENLKTFANKMKSQPLLSLLDNKFGQQIQLLNVQQGQRLRDQSILCMLFHLSLALSNCDNKNFLNPLIALATNPAVMMNAFLPTMPQDDLTQIKQVLAGTVIYRCPNGHAYAIGECGRPYVESRCNECGAKIGGTGHNLVQGNVQDTGVDNTKTGHILGDAAHRPVTSLPERKLSRHACAILRLLTHAALLLGCDISSRAIVSMVKPAPQNVCQFFWNHIQKDVEQLQRGIGKSLDDVFLMLHFIFNLITESTTGNVFAGTPVTLSSKQERETWEDRFTAQFVSPVLQDLDNLLQTLNHRIMKDKRFGQDKLLNILYEVDTTDNLKSVADLHDIPDVWRYRSRITLDHFLREFQLQMENTKKEKSNRVLRFFHSESYYLQAMQYIPSILTLQRHLMLKFRRRLDRAEAYKLTIKDVLRSENNNFNMEELFNNFVAAWECVKEKLLDYGCLSLHGVLIRLPEDFRNKKITSDSQLAVLLPSTTGPGLCSYILLEYLLRKHNEFLEMYSAINRQSSLPTVQVKDLKSNHLICYHPEKDLLPLVLANCSYSFKLGEGTKVEYDFDGFENQLTEMVLQAKSKVHQQNGIITLETMLYRADTANAGVFRTLRSKVKQEVLSPAVQLQIKAELHASLPDICDSIDNLDIAVSFLKSLGGDDSHSLQLFMIEVLKMKQTITSQKAQQVCRFKHVQSLWLLLNMEKSQVLAAHNQDAFDNLGQDVKEELSQEQTNELVAFCQHQTLNKLEFLLQEIFDCILLRIAQPQAHRDEDAVDLKRYKLRDVIYGNIEGPLYDTNTADSLLVEDLQNFPDSIKGSQATLAWLTVFKQTEEKRRQAL